MVLTRQVPSKERLPSRRQQRCSLFLLHFLYEDDGVACVFRSWSVLTWWFVRCEVRVCERTLLSAPLGLSPPGGLGLCSELPDSPGGAALGLLWPVVKCGGVPPGVFSAGTCTSSAGSSHGFSSQLLIMCSSRVSSCLFFRVLCHSCKLYFNISFL